MYRLTHVWWIDIWIVLFWWPTWTACLVVFWVFIIVAAIIGIPLWILFGGRR